MKTRVPLKLRLLALASLGMTLAGCELSDFFGVKPVINNTPAIFETSSQNLHEEDQVIVWTDENDFINTITRLDPEKVHEANQILNAYPFYSFKKDDKGREVPQPFVENGNLNLNVNLENISTNTNIKSAKIHLIVGLENPIFSKDKSSGLIYVNMLLVFDKSHDLTVWKNQITDKLYLNKNKKDIIQPYACDFSNKRSSKCVRFVNEVSSDRLIEKVEDIPTFTTQKNGKGMTKAGPEFYANPDLLLPLAGDGYQNVASNLIQPSTTVTINVSYKLEDLLADKIIRNLIPYESVANFSVANVNTLISYLELEDGTEIIPLPEKSNLPNIKLNPDLQNPFLTPNISGFPFNKGQSTSPHVPSFSEHSPFITPQPDESSPENGNDTNSGN